MATLKINRGTSYTRSGNVTVDGTPVSLVGGVVRHTWKTDEFSNSTDDNDASLKKDITTGTVLGAYDIAIDPIDTATLLPGTYYYDTKVKLADGRVFKVDEGKIALDGSATNRLS